MNVILQKIVYELTDVLEFFRAWRRMTCRFEDGGEVFSKGIEKCRLTQLRVVCYVYVRFINNTFLSKGTICR